MKIKKFDIFVWVVTVIFIGGIFFLPDIVPVHFNGDWEIDRYGSRYEVLILALLPIVSYYGILLTKKIDPKRNTFQSREKSYELLRKAITVFMMILYVYLYLMMKDQSLNGALMMSLIMGSMFILLGNYMPKLPQNFFMGVRTPWAISNEEVWRKTQKFGGYSFVVAGIVLIIWGLLSLPYMTTVVIVIALLITVVDCGYSYIVYKKLENR